MRNQFGIKDLVLMVLVVITIVLVFLGMVQRDRLWDKMGIMESRLGEIERATGRVQEGLEQGLTSRVDALQQKVDRIQATLDSGVIARAGSAEGPSPAAAAPASADSWARPGVAVERQPPREYASDPRGLPGFRTGEEFVEAFEAQTAKIVPFLDQDTYSRRVTDQVIESLAAYDPETLQLRGVLAEAWQVDPNGLWLRAKINPRARFSDGTPVTAEDARWTFHEFIMNSTLEAESVRSVYDVIDRVEVIDELVVEFVFKEAFSSNVDQALTMYITPKHFYSKFSPAQLNPSTGLLMGSGPFKLENLNPDSQWAPPADVVLVRNETYWAGIKPAFDRLRYKAINDELTRLVSYRNGEVHMTTPSSPQFVRVTQEPGWGDKSHSLRWVNMRSGYAGIAWQCGERNGKLTPFHDKRVRQAMTHALDRAKMIREIWEGIGEVATQPCNSASPSFDPTIQAWPYDLDRAKALLAEAGWVDRNNDGVVENERGDRFIFEFTYAKGGEIAERIVRYVRDQCRLIGVECVLNGVDWSIQSDVQKRRDFDAIILGWSSNGPESDPSQIFHSKSIQNQGNNFGQWNSPEADALMEAARRELNFEKRMKILHDFHRVVHEEQPYTWIRMSPWLRFVSKSVNNVQTYPKGIEQIEMFMAGGSTALPPG